MNTPTVYYYEVFLTCFDRHHLYKLSLGCFPNYRLKTTDIFYPSLDFILNLIDNETISNNIEEILSYNSSLLSVEPDTLESIRYCLTNLNYFLDIETISESSDALGDPNNNNKPYANVNDEQVIFPPSTTEPDLSNTELKTYTSTFNVTILYPDFITTFVFNILSAEDPLPQPINKSITSIQDLYNYLSSFFDTETLESLLLNAQSILSIAWLGNFWNIYDDTDFSTNNYSILEENANSDSVTYEAPKVVKLTGETVSDATASCEFKDAYISGPNLTFVDKEISNYLMHKVNVRFQPGENAQTTPLRPGLGSIGAWAQTISPAFLVEPNTPKVNGYAPTFPGVMIPKDPKTPFLVGNQFWAFDVGDKSSLPRIRIVFYSPQTVPDAPDSIDISISIKFFVLLSYKKKIKSFNFDGPCKLIIKDIDGDITEDISIQKFNGKEKGPDFDACENIVSEEDHVDIINKINKKLSYTGSALPNSNLRQLKIEFLIDEIKVPLRSSNKIKPFFTGSLPQHFAVEYSAKPQDFFGIISDAIKKSFNGETLSGGFDDAKQIFYETESTKSIAGNFLTDLQKRFGENIYNRFRDLILQKANAIHAQKYSHIPKDCCRVEYSDATLEYDWYPIVLTMLNKVNPGYAILTDPNLDNLYP